MKSRAEFTYDQATIEGQIIRQWLDRQANQAQAIRSLIIAAATGKDNLEATIERVVTRVLERYAIRMSDDADKPQEDEDLARTLDNLF